MPKMGQKLKFLIFFSSKMWYFAQHVSKKPLFWGVHPKIDLFIFGAAGAEEKFFGAAPSPPGGGGCQPVQIGAGPASPNFPVQSSNPPGGLCREVCSIHLVRAPSISMSHMWGASCVMDWCPIVPSQTRPMLMQVLLDDSKKKKPQPQQISTENPLLRYN